MPLVLTTKEVHINRNKSNKRLLVIVNIFVYIHTYCVTP